MKSERRHELEQNALADWLGNTIKQIQPHVNTILAGILGVFAIILLYMWWSQSSQSVATNAWGSYYAALGSRDPADFEAVIENFPGTDVADWARVTAADVYLANGCDQLFESKDNAQQELQKAIEHYKQALNSTRNPLLRERATFGLARGWEALGGVKGDLKEAREQYEKLVKQWPDGVYSKVASKRLEDLKQGATQSFYTAFAEFDPRPELADEPGTPGERPAFDLDSLPGDSVIPARPLMELDEQGADLESSPSGSGTDSSSDAGE